MKKINFSIWVTTMGLVCFVVLCSHEFSFVFLQLILVALTASMIWMVITILKNGDPSPHSFDERFYEDSDLGPR